MWLAHGAGGSMWAWNPHPDVWAAVGLLLGGYFLALKVLGPRKVVPGVPAATGTQKALFVAGALALWLAADWPLHDLSEGYSFSAHMIQHLAFALVAPPLLLLGTPKWLLRTMLGRGVRFRAVRFVTKPLVALILFNVVMVGIHWPAVVALQVSSEVAHLAVHTALVGAALAMWWPVVAPLPELSTLTPPAKMFYLFLQSILPTVPASFLTFATVPLYPVYEGWPHPFGLSTLNDQLVAGLIMKLGGGLLLWAIITGIFFRWYAQEESGQVQELDWEDFEHELDAWELRR